MFTLRSHIEGMAVCPPTSTCPAGMTRQRAAHELTNQKERRLDAAALNLFLSTFPGICEDFSDLDRIIRRFFGAGGVKGRKLSHRRDRC
jgi:hypothetical protein